MYLIIAIFETQSEGLIQTNIIDNNFSGAKYCGSKPGNTF